LKFADVLRVERISLGRVAKYIYNLKVLSEKLLQQTKSETGFDDADKKTIDALIISINENNRYTPHTKRDFVIALKRFYQWLKAPPEEYSSWKRRHRYPEEVDDLSTNLKLNETTLPGDLFSQDEVSKIVRVATHPMLKAFVALSDELGPRPGEILGMRVRDIVFDGTDLLCKLSGKTGMRVEYVVKSTSLLSQWLDAHPFKDTPDSPLWLNLNNNNRHERWSYAACKKALKLLAKQAGVMGKKVNPYVFRHTAASRDAKLGFTEAQLCRSTAGSSAPRCQGSTYTSLGQT
jgi:integrase